jgi:Grx4 family monothiol glutaredoxin
MNEVVQELAKKYESVLVLGIDADALYEVAESFEIKAVPTCILLRGHTLLDRIEGADAKKLTDAVAKHAATAARALSHSDAVPAVGSIIEPADVEETLEQLEARCRRLMNQDRVVLFMKGSPATPKCKFSRATVEELSKLNIQYAHFDILTDSKVREQMKVINSWPTFPQIIVNGELIGGLDILRQEIQSGEFQRLIGVQ